MSLPPSLLFRTRSGILQVSSCLLKNTMHHFHDYISVAGADPQQIYNHENDAWYFSKGNSTLEVFLTSYETAEKVVRTFIRCLSAIYPIPVEPAKRQELYFVALEVNARNMGVKIGTMA